MSLLRGKIFLFVHLEERPGRLTIGAKGGNRNEFPLRVAQGRELAAKDATGVNVYRARNAAPDALNMLKVA